MKENNKLLIILGGFGLLSLLIIISMFSDKKTATREGTAINYISYSEYEEKLKSNNNEFVVLVQTGCGYCEKAKEVFQKIYDEYGYTIDALNITDLTDTEKQSLLASNSYFSEESWGTPLLLVVKNNEIVDKHNGYGEFDVYTEFLTSNNLIGDKNE